MRRSATTLTVPDNSQGTGRYRAGTPALLAAILVAIVAVEEARLRWTTFRLKAEMYASQEQALLRLAEQTAGEGSWYQLVAEHPESNVIRHVHRGQDVMHEDLPRLIADRQRQAARYRAQATEAHRLRNLYQRRW